MATNDPILHLLQAQGATGFFDSEGHFKIDREALKERYGSLLENDLEAVLFFAQCAHRWKANKLELTILKKRFQARLHLPEQSIVLARLGSNPTRVLEAFFPQSHPLFELAMGYNILTYSALTQETEVSLDENVLCFHWDFQGKISLLSSTRMKIVVLLLRRLFPELPVSMGGRNLAVESFPTAYLHYHFSFGEVPVPWPVVACQKNVLKAWSVELDQAIDLEVQETDQSKWMMKRNDDSHPIFLNLTSVDSPIVYYFSSTLGHKGPTLVPVRYGVPLEPITLSKELGTAVVFVNIEHLQTDLSGLKLVQDEAYHDMIENTRTYLRTKLEFIKNIQRHYQPKIERQEVFKKGLAASLLTPPTIAFGLVLGGAGAILKSALVLKALAATSPIGLLANAQTLADPSHHTRSKRKANFGWLEKLPKASLDSVPPPPAAEA